MGLSYLMQQSYNRSQWRGNDVYQDRPDILFLCFVFQLILLLLLLSGCQTRPAPTTQKGGGELCCCSIATEMLSDFTELTQHSLSPLPDIPYFAVHIWNDGSLIERQGGTIKTKTTGVESLFFVYFEVWALADEIILKITNWLIFILTFGDENWKICFQNPRGEAWINILICTL